jgi:hypothetical protein
VRPPPGPDEPSRLDKRPTTVRSRAAARVVSLLVVSLLVDSLLVDSGSPASVLPGVLMS